MEMAVKNAIKPATIITNMLAPAPTANPNIVLVLEFVGSKLG